MFNYCYRLKVCGNADRCFGQSSSTSKAKSEREKLKKANVFGLNEKSHGMNGTLHETYEKSQKAEENPIQRELHRNYFTISTSCGWPTWARKRLASKVMK